jgi:hypothetical protein
MALRFKVRLHQLNATVEQVDDGNDHGRPIRPAEEAKSQDEREDPQDKINASMEEDLTPSMRIKKDHYQTENTQYSCDDQENALEHLENSDEHDSAGTRANEWGTFLWVLYIFYSTC